MDTMITMMEKYTDHLEDIVAERTAELSLQLRKQRLTSFCTGCFQSKLRLKLPRIKYHANFFNTIHIRIRNKPAALPCNSQHSRYLDIHLVSGIRMACANPAMVSKR